MDDIRIYPLEKIEKRLDQAHEAMWPILALRLTVETCPTMLLH